MLQDIKDSIKAKLYDFAYTPFMSSVLISWIVINHKYLLIYFADYDLEKKLKLLNDHDFAVHTLWFYLPNALNVLIPIVFGLFYVFVYPLISKKFYSYTLARSKELKEIKKEIEDKTPLTREEEREIRQELDRLTVERDEIQNRLTKTEQYYEEKYQKRVTALEMKSWEEPAASSPTTTTVSDSVEEEVEDLEGDHEIEEEDDRTKVLRFFYESNYKTKSESGVLDLIVEKTKIRRPKAQLILDEMLENGLLSRSQDGNRFISITKYGNEILLKKFDHE